MEDLGSEKFSPNRSRKNLYQIQEFYRVTRLDPSFQRLGGVFHGSGWSYAQACDYLNSILEGSVENKIILAHVKNCLRHAQDIGDQKSIDYFSQTLDLGYEYVSIDGNNTSSTIYAWLKGKPVGKKKKGKKEVDLFLQCPNLKESIPESEGMYTKLDMEMQQKISASEKLDVTVYHTITIDEMCTKFRKTNTSTHLNAQEYRQARVSPLANSIRSWVEEHKDFFKSIVLSKSASLDKRTPDEMIAQLALFMGSKEHSSDLLKKNLDKFYEDTDVISPEANVEVKKILETSSRIAKSIGPLHKKIGKAECFALWYFLYVVQSSGLHITDEKAFFEWFCQLSLSLEVYAGELPSKESEDHSYKEWRIRHDQSTYFRKMLTLFEEIVAGEAQVKIEEGVLKRGRSSKDIFSESVKKILLVRQGFKDRFGKELTAIDYYMGKLHADHMVSVKDGGETVLENGEMMRAEDNLKKGPASYEPYFRHQTYSEKCENNI